MDYISLKSVRIPVVYRIKRTALIGGQVRHKSTQYETKDAARGYLNKIGAVACGDDIYLWKRKERGDWTYRYEIEPRYLLYMMEDI